jgi:hypothetical protein
MVYVKVDEQGNVLEFPYRFRDLRKVPEDAVKCDTVSQKPTVKWYEGLWYDRVEKEGDKYVVYYTIGLKKYSSVDEKKKTLAVLIAQAKVDSAANLSSGKITQEQHDDNMKILDDINVDDETTYDSFDTIKLQ